MIDVKSITTEERVTVIQNALSYRQDGRIRCSRCREVIDLNQDCPKCKRSWESWLKVHVWSLREERKEKEIKKVVAEGDASQLYFNFDLEGEVEF